MPTITVQFFFFFKPRNLPQIRFSYAYSSNFIMATSTKKFQEAPLRAKRAPAPSKKLTDTSNTATPQLSAHSEAIALKRAEDAKRLADQQRAALRASEQDPTPSESLSVTGGLTAENLRSISPAKRSRDESNNDNNPSDSENKSSTSVGPEKPKSSTIH
jgi:hypothetical protein